MNTIARFSTRVFARLVMALFLSIFFQPVNSHFEKAGATDVIPPTVTAIDPSSAFNDLDTPVTITGNGFLVDLTDPSNPVQPAATLGSIALSDVTWVDAATLTATVPWGMDPGVYPLTVVNPDGGSSSLADAFTVKQGIGLWNGGDLYGGVGQEVRLKPGDPNTIYAMAYYGCGIFRSQDAGEHWTFINGQIGGNATFVTDPMHPDWLYLDASDGIYRSQDEGDTWKKRLDTWPDGRSLTMGRVYPSPLDPQVLFVSSSGQAGDPTHGVLGLIKSTDGGASWEVVNDMNGIPVTAVAFHPTDALQMVLGTQDGRVFQSGDGGETWSEVNKPAAIDVGLITYNPYRPSEVWVSNGWMHSSEGAGLYKSTAPDFTEWQGETPADSVGNPGTLWFIKFTGPDSVYTNLHHSTNGGHDWNPFGPPNGDGEYSFDPEHPDIGYIGDEIYGVEKTTDGGLTWEVKNQGFTGMVALQIEASRFNPQRVFATFFSWPGFFRSDNGANTWTYFQIPNSWNVRFVREDPVDPEHLYVAADAGFYVSTDGGETWFDKGWNIPPSYKTGNVTAFELDPAQPGHMLAGFQTGLNTYNTKSYGQLYSSNDYGENWDPITVMPGEDQATPIDIAFHPGTAGLVYLSSQFLGLYRSKDHGGTWERIDDPNLYYMQWLHNITIATHPQNVMVVGDGSDPYRSWDGGDTWQDGQAPYPNGYSTYMFLDGDSTRLYAGSAIGLSLSSNAGNSWTRAAGILGKLNITALGSGVGKDYTIIYAATTGGNITTSKSMTASTSQESPATASNLVKAGVYRYVKQKTVGLPGVPVLVSPANNALTTLYKPKLDWKDAANAQHYELQVSTDKTFATMLLDKLSILPSEFTFVSDLTPNTNYYWRVRTYNSIGKPSAWSKVRSFRTALPAPINLNTDGSVQDLRPSFSWSMPTYPAPTATSFTLQISRNTTFTQLVRTGKASGTSYIPSADLPRNLPLFWRVRANGLNGPSSWSTGTYTTGNPPAIPALVAPANNVVVTSYTPSLTWNQSTFQAGTSFQSYRIEVAIDAAFTSIARNATITDATVTFWVVDPALDPNTKYYWHVQACDTDSECSTWSKARTFKTK